MVYIFGTSLVAQQPNFIDNCSKLLVEPYTYPIYLDVERQLNQEAITFCEFFRSVCQSFQDSDGPRLSIDNDQDPPMSIDKDQDTRLSIDKDHKSCDETSVHSRLKRIFENNFDKFPILANTPVLFPFIISASHYIILTNQSNTKDGNDISNLSKLSDLYEAAYEEKLKYDHYVCVQLNKEIKSWYRQRSKSSYDCYMDHTWYNSSGLDPYIRESDTNLWRDTMIYFKLAHIQRILYELSKIVSYIVLM